MLLYGVPIKVSGTVDQRSKSEWRHEYELHRVRATSDDVHKLLEERKLNVEVVRIIADCITATEGGLWISVHVIDACKVSVRAGYASDSWISIPHYGTLSASNGTCEALTGLKDATYGEGMHFKIPLVETAITMNLRVQKQQESATVASKDSQDATTQVAVNFQVDPSLQ
jgi:hypothetical protein